MFLRTQLCASVKSDTRHRRPAGKRKTLNDIMQTLITEGVVAREKGLPFSIPDIHRRAHELFYEEEKKKIPPSLDVEYRKFIPREPNLTGVSHLTEFFSPWWPIPSPRNDYEGVGTGSGNNENDALVLSSNDYLHHEIELLRFIRSNTLGLRKTLPVLHECWCAITHRLLHCESEYVKSRNRFFGLRSIEPNTYIASEERIREVRAICGECFRAHYSAVFDPAQFATSATGKVLSMNETTFQSFIDVLRKNRQRSTTAFLQSGHLRCM